MSVKRLAVAGAGKIGQRHIEMMARMPERAMLAAVTDPAETTAGLARRLGVTSHPSVAEMIAAGPLDGVIIASPNHLHVEQALVCIQAGLPVLVEKPIAHTTADARRLCEAAEAAGVPVLIGHHRRHSSIIDKAVEVIASGVLGRIVAVTGSALFCKPEVEGYFDGAYRWRREPGGGPVLLNMIHEVSNLRALCGEIVAVQAFTSNATRGFAVEDSAAISLRFASGALGTFILSDTVASDRSWEHVSGEDPQFDPGHTDEDDCYLVAGTMGSLAIPTMRLQCYRDEASRSWHQPLIASTIALEPVDPLERQLAHFIDVIEGRASPRVSARDGLRNLQIIESILESSRNGRQVLVEPVTG